MPRRCGGTWVTSRPLIVMVPVSGWSRPAMARSRVDLPDPLGPSSAVSEPDGHLEVDVVQRGEVAVALVGAPHGDRVGHDLRLLEAYLSARARRASRITWTIRTITATAISSVEMA